MGSRGQAAGGVWREISPKAEVLAQVGYLCGLPGKLLAPPRPCAEDRSFTSPRVISPSSPLRLRFSPDSLLGSAGARGVEYTPITHSRMEKQTQEGWGGAWNLARGTQAGSRDRRGSSTSRVQNVPGAKHGHTGHAQRLGDSEQRFSTEGLILPVAPLWTGTLSFHIFLCTCFFLGRWLRLPRPLQSSML